MHNISLYIWKLKSLTDLYQMEDPSFLYLFSKGPIFSLLFLVMCLLATHQRTNYWLYLCPRLRTPPLIRTEKELSDKVQLLEVRYVWIGKYYISCPRFLAHWFSVSSCQALGDIEIAIKLVRTELQSPEHPLDQHYRKLHCALHPLDHESYEFKVRKMIIYFHNNINDPPFPIPLFSDYFWLRENLRAELLFTRNWEGRALSSCPCETIWANLHQKPWGSSAHHGLL